MSKQVNIHAAKTNFSKLCEQVEAGEEVVIARAGKPILKLVKIEEDPKPALKSFGFARHLVTGYDEEEFNALDEVIWSEWHKKEFDLGEVAE